MDVVIGSQLLMYKLQDMIEHLRSQSYTLAKQSQSFKNIQMLLMSDSMGVYQQNSEDQAIDTSNFLKSTEDAAPITSEVNTFTAFSLDITSIFRDDLLSDVTFYVRYLNSL